MNFGARSRVTVVTRSRSPASCLAGAAPVVPSLAGFTVLVADLDHVAELLARNGVPFQAAGTRIVVSAADACGCAVLFET